MISAIQNQILLYLSIAIVMFLPGWFLLLAIFGKSENQISKLEKFVFCFGRGIIVNVFIAVCYNKINIPVTAS